MSGKSQFSAHSGLWCKGAATSFAGRVSWFVGWVSSSIIIAQRHFPCGLAFFVFGLGFVLQSNRPAPSPGPGLLVSFAGWVSFSKIIAQRRVPVPRKASGGPAGLTSKSQKMREQRFSQSYSVGSTLLRGRVTTRGQWVPRGHPAFWLVWFVSAHSFQTHLPTAT